jgi:putative membrane protein
VEIRQFIFVFLATLPLGILYQGMAWLTPILTMLIAFPILALDEIGVELQNPFSKQHLNHLPLDEICEGLERNLTALLSVTERPERVGRDGVKDLPAPDRRRDPLS